jgi:hypothetical protein
VTLPRLRQYGDRMPLLWESQWSAILQAVERAGLNPCAFYITDDGADCEWSTRCPPLASPYTETQHGAIWELASWVLAWNDPSTLLG